MLFLHRRVIAVSALLAAVLAPAARAQVVINELCAKSSEQSLQYLSDGTPVLGYLPKWNAPTYSDAAWSSGQLPAGYGSTVTTNLQSAMQNKAPSLYLRKTFTATAAQAASTQPLVLQVDYDDGFAAYINGIEVARYNCGGPKHFMYAAQTAYNATTASGVTEVTLGAANTLLVSGTNTLSIEARNYDFGSNFRINAGLKLVTSTVPITVTKAFYDHNTATGASKTHTNTNGAASNTSSGTPIVNGWLAGAPNPTSDNLWTSLQIVTAELAGAGLGGTGGLRYTITQSGTNRTASVSGPPVNMSNAWLTGAMAPSALTSTTVKFRYRTTGELQFGVRFDPGVGQGANSTDGFPVVGLPIGGAADYDWSAAAGGYYGSKIDAAGAKTSPIGGSINVGNYEHSVGAGVRSGEVRLIEDNTAGAGPGGGTGILTYTYIDFPSVIDTLGFGIKGLKVTEWPASGAIPLADFQRGRLSFRWKMPAGRVQTFYIEAATGGTAADRGIIGNLTGTGNWESYSVSINDLPQSAALRTKLGQASPKLAKLTCYYAGVPFADGESVQIDNLNLYYEPAGAALDENIPNNFSAVNGAIRTRTINGAGGVNDATTGTMVNNITLNSDPGLTGFTFRVVEDNTAGTGNGGSTGFLRCEVTQAPAAGAPWGFSLPGLTVRNWTSGAITAAQLSDVGLQFAAKIPAGVTMTLYAEPVGGSSANRASLGTLTGNGTWQTVTREFNGAANVDNFRTALNTAGTTAFQLTFVGPNNPAVGDQISIDDVLIDPWRVYSTLMDAGTNQQRFLDALNNASSITFVPTFVKLNAPNGGSGTLSIDDFEVTYNGQDPNAVQPLIGLGGVAGNWKYFVGIAEPSGGLYDPVLITTVVPPPAGEEDDYDNPKSFRDWVELKNLGASAVTLTNWTMTDDNNYPAKWKFPTGKQIAAGGYLIVMCDNRDEANGTGTYTHSNFTLSAGDPKIYLYNASGVLQAQMTTAPSQDSFHTWGRLPDGTGAFGFLDTGTPGQANAGISYSAQAKIPDYFKADGVTPFPGGFYAGSQTLVMKCDTVGAEIRYTTDGTDPTETTGTVYTAPITLTPPADHKSALVYRARAFKAGLLKSDSKTHSYLLDLDVKLKAVPAMVFSGNAGQNFYAPNGVLAIVGGTFPGNLWQANGPASYNIAINHGDDVERQVQAEFYYPDGKDGWREEVGIRPAASPYSRPYLRLDQTALSPWIRSHDQKISFNVYWRNDYGNSSVQDDNFIPGNDVTEYSRLRIRAGKNDIANPFINDEMARRLYRDMGWVQPTGTINTLYVNGSFKGMFNACERLRGKTFALHYRSTNDFDVRYIGEMVDGDATFWNQMQTALNTLSASPTLANYQNLQNYLDVTNVADYFLHNIYINNNDWPNNNWAAQRERTAAGRYRMAEWDCEGAFGLFGQAVNYNTLDGKLLGGNNTECGNIFKALYNSAEFKLLFADRIQKHMFNGGVLDDRGSTDHFQQIVNQLSTQATPLISYIENQALNLGLYNAHVAAGTGRRVYLFSTDAGSFSNKGLWPATLPPAFSQFGGVVPAHYQLTITMSAPAGAVIYYTLDGSDPRLPGGAIAPSAIAYSGPVTLDFLTTVNARIRFSDGTWSALNSAYFEPAAAQPTATTLVVSELMFHPPDPTYPERIAGYEDSDDFEFVRLTNVGTTPLDLSNLRFNQGITYDFSTSPVSAFNPGTSVLIVKNKDAFQYRYGQSYNGTIVGEYAGSFSNSGETVTLAIISGGNTSTLHTFTYNSGPPWYKAADGHGPSLMLLNPNSAPTHNNAANWTVSAQPGGMPGGVVRPLTYAGWKQYVFNEYDTANNAVSGQFVDPEFDGMNNFLEYTLGAYPGFPDGAAYNPVVSVETFGGLNYVTLTYALNAGASDATVVPEVSSNLSTWASGGGNVVTVSGPTTNVNGSVTWKVRDATPTTSANKRYIHLKATGP